MGVAIGGFLASAVNKTTAHARVRVAIIIAAPKARLQGIMFTFSFL